MSANLTFNFSMGTAVGVVTSAGETEVTAATIAARSDLYMFLNLSDAAKITTTAGGLLTQWEAVNDSTFQFVPDGGSGLTLSDFGSNGGKSVDFDGAYMLKDDSTAAEPGTGTVCFLFNSQDLNTTPYWTGTGLGSGWLTRNSLTTGVRRSPTFR